MSALRRFLDEIHGRSLWQVFGVYAAGSWVALEIVATFREQLSLPSWVFTGTILLLLIGLPVVMATAFVQRGLLRRPDGEAHGARRWLTWRSAGIAGGGAFAVLGVGTAAYMTMRTLGIGPPATLVSSGAIRDGEPVVMADLEDRAGDPRLSTTITEALRYQLEQTPVLEIVGPERLRVALRRMTLPDTTSITGAIAGEIIRRQGIRAYVTGSVSTLGNTILVTIRLTGADGVTLLSRQEDAGGEGEVMDAVDRLARHVRERAGESLRSVRAAPPLEDATTASLAALELYSEGTRLYRNRRFDAAVELFRQAVAADSTFAEAYVHLAHGLRDAQLDRRGQVAAISRAYELRDRLPELRRLFVEAVYHGPIFRDETERSLEALRAARVLDPAAPAIHGYIAFVHRARREHDSALVAFHRAAALDTLTPRAQAGVVRMLWNLDRFDAADSALAVMERRLPESPWTLATRRTRPLVVRDWEAADSLAAEVPGARAAWSMNLFHGRLDRAAGPRDAAPAAPDASVFEALVATRSAAYVDLIGRGGDPGLWVARLDSLFARLPADFSPHDEDPDSFLNIARLYAMLGAPGRARAILEAFDAGVVEGFLGELAPDRDLTVAEIALAEGRTGDALTAFRAADSGYRLTFALPNLARAYDRIGRPDSAIAVAERLLATTYWDGTWTLLYPIWYERLGQLYDDRGDLEDAARYYARFVEAWADPDPDLQPRVAAARARLQAILDEIG